MADCDRLFILLVLCPVLVLQTVSRADISENGCDLYIPSTDASGSCVAYDLTQLASLPGVSFTSDYNYTLAVCGNVQNVPAVCSGKNSAPAYQYNSSNCYVIGQLQSSYVFPVDPTNSSAGIRIAYNDGEGGSKYWPRAVIYDFYCDPNAGIGRPLSVVEWPTYTYKGVGTKSQGAPPQRWAFLYKLLRFRPRPSWFDDAKFGIFIHWGVYSVPSFKSEWYWQKLMSGTPEYVEFHNSVYGCSGVMTDQFPCNGSIFSYADFAAMFKAELFNPDEWASVIKRAGAKYVVFTSKHHEGFCNFPSPQHFNWNSMDVGPNRDLVADLSASVRAVGLRMGLYHSLREWFHPLYLQDQKDNCSTTLFVDEIITPTLMQLVNTYKPDVVWSDGSGDNPCSHDSVRYWKAPEFLSWVYNESPIKDTVVINNRNLLLNAGPTADGRILPIFEERLTQMGAWLSINGEAIYGSVPWRVQNDTVDRNTWYTASKDGLSVFAITFVAPTPGGEFVLTQPVPTVSTSVTLLGYNGILPFTSQSDGVQITFPVDIPFGTLRYAWTIKMTNVN
eukprot:Em0013g510a